MTPSRLLMAALLWVQLGPGIARAAGADDEAAAASATNVQTRAIVRSIGMEDGHRLYIRLKLLPRSKVPFSTLTFRVLDARLVEGLREGDSVAFTAARVEGENRLTAIRTVPPCERFRECR